jgi:hypothetical protein
MSRKLWITAIVVAACMAANKVMADGRGALKPAPSIHAPSYDDARRQVLTWLEDRPVASDARKPIERLWPSTLTGDDRPALLDRVAASAAIADSRAANLVTLCNLPRSGVNLPDVTWLGSDEMVPFVRDNLRLLYGRWLSHQRLYDQSLEQLKDLKAADVVDPATLLFYQSVVYHKLLQKDDGLKSLDRLLNEVSEVPARYEAIGSLMRSDLAAVKDDSLDHIARRMDDVQRRLDLGHAGNKVREVEDGIIASLDKLIEDMEKQQQQSQASSSAGSSSTPMQQPRLAPANGAGDVDHKRIGNSSGWGDLPPKQREEALQQIGKDFPAHYRDVIEQYFRRLASQSDQR